MLMASGVSSEIALLHCSWQSYQGRLRHCQTLLRRRHVSIPKLVRYHQIHFRPHRQHRLIAPLSCIAAQGFLFAALNKRCILVYGRYLLVRATPPHFPHQIPVHLSQTVQRGILARNVGDRSGQSGLLSRRDVLLS